MNKARRIQEVTPPSPHAQLNNLVDCIERFIAMTNSPESADTRKLVSTVVLLQTQWTVTAVSCLLATANLADKTTHTDLLTDLIARLIQLEEQVKTLLSVHPLIQAH